MGFAFSPLTDVAVIVNAPPDSVPLLEALNPFSVVDLAVAPSENAFSISFTMLEVAIVAITLWVPFETFTVADVLLPCAFVLAAIGILHHSDAIAAVLSHYSNKDG